MLMKTVMPVRKYVLRMMLDFLSINALTKTSLVSTSLVALSAMPEARLQYSLAVNTSM